jgi:hypothetical protein
MAGHEIGFEEPPQACRPISGLIPNKAGFAAFEVRAGSIRATRCGHRQTGLVRPGDRRGGVGHTVVAGLRPMMSPLVEDAIRADQKDEQQLLARSA